MQTGELFKDFKPDFLNRFFRKSGFFCRHVTHHKKICLLSPHLLLQAAYSLQTVAFKISRFSFIEQYRLSNVVPDSIHSTAQNEIIVVLLISREPSFLSVRCLQNFIATCHPEIHIWTQCEVFGFFTATTHPFKEVLLQLIPIFLKNFKKMQRPLYND